MTYSDPEEWEWEHESDEDRIDREDREAEAEGNGYYRDTPIRNDEGEIIDSGGWGI